MMSENTNGSSEWFSSDSVEEALNYLRWRLEQAGATSGPINELLEMLRQMQEEADAGKRDEEMLSLLVDDALRNTDIASRYPQFFKKLLANEKLREAFLDSLDLLEQSRKGTLRPLPAPPSHDLDFLYENEPAATIERGGEGKWRISWQQETAQLQRVFSLSDLVGDETLFLQAGVAAPDDWLTLFHQTSVVDGMQLEVALEALRSGQEPLLSVRATATIMPKAGNGTGVKRRLRVGLQWGQLDESVPVNLRNQAVFSPIPLATILDSSGSKVVSPLQLTVEVT
jgi:hypothetical protein